MPEEEIINDATPNCDADTDSQATSTKSHRRSGGKVPHEYLEQIENFSGGPMLPSDVCFFPVFGLLLRNRPMFKLWYFTLA